MVRYERSEQKNDERGLTVITNDGAKTAMTTTTISETPVKPSEKTKSNSERMEQRNYEEEKTKAKVKSEN